MKWNKMGLIIGPDKTKWWSQKYCMVPTPEYFEKDNLIRIYYGTCDNENNGRITFIDVNADQPLDIKYMHNDTILDVGTAGMFDDSGVVPSSVIVFNNVKYLYYVGFQRTEKVPYMLFSGLATFVDLKKEFVRISQAPIIERNSTNPISNAAPFVLYDDTEKIFKMWYWLGREWTTLNNKLYIKAVICYAISNDGIHWQQQPQICIDVDETREFSVGRPWVIKDQNAYKMWYSVRYIDKLYRIGYAESTDGIVWIRKDDEAGIDVSADGWDSEMICYPAVLKVKNKTYLFYNGNNNGFTGFGYAELIN